MADLKLLEKQADKMCATLGDWEQNVLRRIGRRLKDIGSMSYADAQAINNAVLAKQDFNAVMVELAQLTGQNVRDVYQMYDDFIAEQHKSKKPLYDYRNKSFVPFADNKDLQAITSAYARTTAGAFVNLSMTKATAIGFVDKNGVFIPMEKQFKQVLDKSVMSLATGTSTFDAEVIEAIKQLGGSGVRVNYGSGVTRSLDGMVRQNLLWGAKQAAKEYEAMVGEELDCDGIEIDWHGNPRPAHEFMQGRQFVIGKSKTVNGKRFDGTDDTTSPISGKNVIDSLNDYGCLHYETHIICGVSEPVYSQQELNRLNAENNRPIEIDGVTKTGYEWKQTMRRLERATRKTRLEREGMKAAGKTAEAKKLNDRINAIKKKYDTIAEKTGIAKDYQRMSGLKANQFNPSSENGISSKRKFFTKENEVDVEYISSKEYKEKFSKLPHDDSVKNAIYEQAKAILTHRKGTYYEDLCLIDAKTGEIKAKSYNNKTENEVVYSDKALKIVSNNKGGLISIHNHGTNNPPTGSDVVSASGKQYQMGIVACHDGSVYTYKPAKKVFSRYYFDKTVDKYMKQGYNEKESIIKVLSEFSDNFGLEWEELK